jgi:hypothetical protein
MSKFFHNQEAARHDFISVFAVFSGLSFPQVYKIFKGIELPNEEEKNALILAKDRIKASLEAERKPVDWADKFCDMLLIH